MSTGSSRKQTAAPRRFFVRRALILAVLVGLVSSGWAARLTMRVEAAGGQAQGPAAGGISPEALAQIEALIREKQARTPAERKIDSQLLYALRAARGEPMAPGVPAFADSLPRDAAGRVIVDVKATVTSDLLANVASVGGDVVNSVPQRAALRAGVPLSEIEALAARPDVIFIQPRQDATTHRAASPDARVASSIGRAPAQFDAFASRRSTMASRLRAALEASPATRGATGVQGAAPPVIPNVDLNTTGRGSAHSEGTVTHEAYVARAVFGVDGTGVKIGVLSNGVDSLAQAQALGDLPAVTILPGQGGSGDEGTAMLEIVHDVAPGAQLFYATGTNGIANFAQNIRDLRAAGCDIIVDDLFYFVESPFQDGQAPGVISNTNGGIVTEAVNAVTAAGALYFSSAGNSGNSSDGESGTWAGDFADGGPAGAPVTTVGTLHSFGANPYNVVTTASSSNSPTSLAWADSLGASSNDYDLFILSSAGTAIVNASTNVQAGTQDPFEIVAAPLASQRIVIVKETGAADRFLQVNTNRGRLSVATSGTTYGHSHAAAAFSTAATPAVGPFPNPFSTSDAVEDFSSDGPRRLFFQADGTAFTPGNFSSTGGILRQKPDITAADGTTVTGVGGFPSPFFGTSAAAPHAAAIAALIKQAVPAATPAQIRTWLTSTAIDIEAPGVDRDSGAGIIMPVPALQAAGLTFGAGLVVDTVTVTENPGNGDGIVQPGEGVLLSATLENLGGAAATGISATLSTTTAGVTIHQPNVSPYPNLAAGASAPNVAPFQFTIASDAPCPLTIAFTLHVTYQGGAGPTLDLPLSFQTGGSIEIATTLDTTAPAASPLYTAVTGLQTARLNRNGVASSCGPPKSFPGVIGAGTRQFDAFTIDTCPSVPAACTKVELINSMTGTNEALFATTYTTSFDPNNLATNYLADAGSSNAVGGPSSYFFTSPDTFVVVVHEVNPGQAIGANYTLRVTGLCLGDCARNGVPTAVAQNLVLPAGAGGTASGSVNNGSSDPDDDPLTITESPAGPYAVGVTPVLLTVTDPSGATSQATATVTVLPTVTGMTPATGPASGGTVVTIAGTGFSTAPGATTVSFGAAAATSVACASTTACQATSPAGTGTVDVRVTVAGQTSPNTAADNFVYIPGPTVTSLAPAAGPELGGTVVMLTGTGFSTTSGETAVTFGAAPATAIACASATTCQATAPPGTGVVAVRVTVAGQTSADTAADDFTYIPAPTVTSIDPAEGPDTGGTVVTITGIGFSTTSGETAVTFGAAPATAVACASATTCQATSPAGTGVASVHVTVAGQTSADTAADDFTYLAPVTYTLAEGATGAFFDNDVLIANPNAAPAPVVVTFLQEDGTTVVDTRTVPAHGRVTVHVDTLPGLDATSASVHVLSEDRLPLVVERTMFWDATGYGGHTAGAVSGPATSWMFAEGSQGFFDTYVLVSNPGETAVDVTLTFLVDGGPPVVRTLPVAASSRLSVWAGGIPELVHRSFGVRVDATGPIMAERAMYFASTPSQLWSGGHATTGSVPSEQWFLAEGATGAFFDTFVLLANPADQAATATLTYLLDSGESVIVEKIVPAASRLTVNVEAEADVRLQNAAFATRVTADRPIIVERSIYWPGDATPWGEAHNSAGLTALGTKWGLAEGRAGGARAYRTYVLLANPQATAAEVRVTFLRESGAPIVETYTVPATSRFNIAVNDLVPALIDESFGVLIEVTNGVPIAVERSMYWDANGIFWSGGTNATATRLP